MNRKLIIAIFMVLLASCAHNGNNSSTVDIANSADTAENSLDWGGVYKGVLPCADCLGIETTLTLKYDNSYILEEKYLVDKNKSLASTIEENKGSFVWDKKNTSIIKLNNVKAVFFIGEGYAERRGLDKSQSSNKNLNYTLTKIEDN